MERLRAPFPAQDVEWRVGRTFANGEKGVMLPFISARGIQQRLDEVFGVEGWTPEYKVVPDMGVICTLRCKAGDAEIVKSDGAEFSQVAGLKGGISGSLKRAASVMGIGRYLYDLNEVNVNLSNKRFYGKIVLPDKYLPEEERSGNDEIKVEYNDYQPRNNNNGGNYEPHKENKGELTEEVKAALEFVINDGSFNNGKKMGEVSIKSLSYMANRGKSEEIKQAAKLVLDYKG